MIFQNALIFILRHQHASEFCTPSNTKLLQEKSNQTVSFVIKKRTLEWKQFKLT